MPGVEALLEGARARGLRVQQMYENPNRPEWHVYLAGDLGNPWAVGLGPTAAEALRKALEMAPAPTPPDDFME